jgi:hypothetical protein
LGNYTIGKIECLGKRWLKRFPGKQQYLSSKKQEMEFIFLVKNARIRKEKKFTL